MRQSRASVAALNAAEADTFRGPVGGASRRCRILTPLETMEVIAVADADEDAGAATPAPLSFETLDGTATQWLRTIAANAVSPGTEPPTVPAQYAYVETINWDLATRVGGKHVTSAVLPQVRQVWRAADGSGRVRITGGPVQFPDANGQKEWVRAGRPAIPDTDIAEPPGGIAAMFPERLPTDTNALTAILHAGHPTDLGPAETLVAIADLYREQDPAAGTRHAILVLLADVPGLSLLGRTNDRLGRPGIAIAADSDMSGLPTRYIFVFDEHTGRLLGQEQILTTTAGDLNVAIPSTISYTAFAKATVTDSSEQTP